MRFARYAFLLAGVYGLLIMPPMYFMEGKFSQARSGMDNPEFYYGFIGVALAWQITFIMIAFDPRRYQLIMLAAWVEKFSYSLATAILFFRDRVELMMLITGIIDCILGVLFVVAFFKTSRDRELERMIVHRDRNGITESSGPLI
jgi:uncharacterized membrane protein